MSERRENWQGMNWIRQDKRLAIYMRDGHACVYCSTHDKLSLDHVVAVSHGGTNSESNLVTACMPCNTARGNKTVKAFAPEAVARIKQATRKSIKALRIEARQQLAAR